MKDDEALVEEVRKSIRLTVKNNTDPHTLDLRDLTSAQETFDEIIKHQWDCAEKVVRSALSRARADEARKVREAIKEWAFGARDGMGNIDYDELIHSL